MWHKPIIRHNELTEYGWIVAYPDNLKLGENTDIGYGTYIQAQCGVYIMKGAKIGGGCFIYSANTINGIYGPVLIGENARIGAQCTILPNVTIRENALIPAHSVVYKNKKGEIIVQRPGKKDYHSGQ